MKIQVNRNKRFMLTIGSDDLQKGLRPVDRSPRNSGYLIECSGAIGRDGVLGALESLSRVDTSVITDSFPYPQIFVFINHTIVCGETEIFELVGDVLISKISGLTAGSTWSAVDFRDYVYMSNRNVVVTRSPVTQEYSINTDLPKASAICNYKGQVIIGSPYTGD